MDWEAQYIQVNEEERRGDVKSNEGRRGGCDEEKERGEEAKSNEGGRRGERSEADGGSDVSSEKVN